MTILEREEQAAETQLIGSVNYAVDWMLADVNRAKVLVDQLADAWKNGRPGVNNKVLLNASTELRYVNYRIANLSERINIILDPSALTDDERLARVKRKIYEPIIGTD